MSNEYPQENPTNPLFKLTPTQLYDGCRQQRADKSNERFCFEMFRRAIQDKNQACWDLIYQQYKKLLFQWIIQQGKSNNRIGDATVEELALSAFSAFWHAFTLEKLQNANGIGSVLSYLKLCAGTTALHEQRQLKHQETQAEWHDETISNQLSNVNIELNIQTELSATELWRIVDSCCKSEQERVLARLSFVSDLLPKAILELHPDLFVSTEEISNIRRNLINRLARNPQLKQLWGAGETG